MRSQVRYVPWLYRLMGHLLGLAIEVLGGVRSVGLENIPASGPGILISNHTTFADPLVAGYGTAWRVDRVVHMMSKAELRTWPVLGWLAAQGGVIFVRRGEADRDAQRNTMDILAAGGLVLLFPEGTRSPDGALIRARNGAALLAMRTGAPIIPIGIHDIDRMLSWKAPFRRRPVCNLHVGPPVHLPHRPQGPIDRAELVDATTHFMRALAELLPPDRRGVYGADSP